MKKIIIMPWDLEKLNRGEVVEGFTNENGNTQKIKVVKINDKIMSFNEPQGVRPYTKVVLENQEKDVPLNLGKEETARYLALKQGAQMQVIRSASVVVVSGDTKRVLTLAEQKAQGSARVITIERTPNGHEPKIISDTGAQRTYLEQYEM